MLLQQFGGYGQSTVQCLCDVTFMFCWCQGTFDTHYYSMVLQYVLYLCLKPSGSWVPQHNKDNTLTLSHISASIYS